MMAQATYRCLQLMYANYLLVTEHLRGGFEVRKQRFQLIAQGLFGLWTNHLITLTYTFFIGKSSTSQGFLHRSNEVTFWKAQSTMYGVHECQELLLLSQQTFLAFSAGFMCPCSLYTFPNQINMTQSFCISKILFLLT